MIGLTGMGGSEVVVLIIVGHELHPILCLRGNDA